jgi:hypothetical protein
VRGHRQRCEEQGRDLRGRSTATTTRAAGGELLGSIAQVRDDPLAVSAAGSRSPRKAGRQRLAHEADLDRGAECWCAASSPDEASDISARTMTMPRPSVRPDEPMTTW